MGVVRGSILMRSSSTNMAEMLRRYSSRGLDGVAIQRKTTIGSAASCDIRLDVQGVTPLHATIEYHPLTRSYWLRDHSIMSTTVNGHAVVGQTELADGDLVRFGDAQPLVFQHDSLVPSGSYMNGGPHSIDGNSSKRYDLQLTELPVIGKRIIPSPNRRVISAKTRRKRSESADIVRKRNSLDQHSSSSSIVGLPPSPTSAPFSRLNSSSTHNRSVGNELLQRVVKLQGEVARRDEEMRIMRAATARVDHRAPASIPSTPPVDETALRQARRENERLRELLMLNGGNKWSNGSEVGLPAVNKTNEESRPLPTPEFEHQIYKAFAVGLASELKRFGDKVLAKSAHDYSDLFSNFVKEMDDPFSIKMLEIEASCEAYLTDKGYDRAADTVRELFRSDTIPEGISGISTHLESLWPVLKDGMTMARDSSRACMVLNNWSKRLGDQIRVSGLTADRLLQAADDLESTFTDGRLKTHWLLPCLHPLLRTAAVALKDKEDGVIESLRRKRSLTHTEAKIAEATGPLLQQIEEEKNRNGELSDERFGLQASLAASEEKVNLMKEQIERLEKAEEELGIVKEDRERERAEYEERIERLEEELRKAVEEKESLEEELVDEAEKIHHNVTQSVEKMRRKRSIRFADVPPRPSSADSDSMSVVTPGMPIQRPDKMLPLTTPAGMPPSPMISLTDTDNTQRALKMASIDEASEGYHEDEEEKESGREAEIEEEQEKTIDDDEIGEDGDEEEKEDEVVSAGEDAQGKEEIKDQVNGEGGEHVIESRSVQELDGEKEGEEEKEKSQDEISDNDEEADAPSGVDDDEETPRVEEGEKEGEGEEEREKREIKDQEGGDTDLVEDEGQDWEEKELSILRDQLARLNELRARAQKQIAPGSTFTSILHPESIGTTQMIFDLTTEFRRTANFLRGLLGVSPLSEFELKEENEEEEKEEGVEEEQEEAKTLTEEKREEILEDLQRLVEFAEVVKDGGKTESEQIESDLKKSVARTESVDNAAIVKQLNDALLDRDDVPKGINEVRFASHLQSHMNSASGRPQTGKERVKLPIKVAQVSTPNGTVVHKPPTPPIRQPRFKF